MNKQVEDFPSSLSKDSSNLDQLDLASRESWGWGHYSFLAGDLKNSVPVRYSSMCWLKTSSKKIKDCWICVTHFMNEYKGSPTIFIAVIVSIIIITNKEPLWHIKQVLSVFVCSGGAMIFSQARVSLEHRIHRPTQGASSTSLGLHLSSLLIPIWTCCSTLIKNKNPHFIP